MDMGTTCGKCQLTNCRKITYEHTEQVDLLVIGESPSQEAIAFNTPFRGKEKKILESLFEQMGITSYCFDYSVKCLLPDGRTSATRKELDACKSHLTELINKVKPKQLLLLGAGACYSILGAKADRGKFYEYNGIPVIYTYATNYILKNRGKFTEWTEHISKLSKKPSKWKDYTWEILDTESKAVSYLLECKKHKYVALDTENTSLSPFGCKKTPRAELLCLTMSYDGDHAVLIPKEVLTTRVVNILRIVCSQCIIIGSNYANYDWKIIKVNLGIETKKVFDTVVAHYLLDENSGENGLKQLAQLYLEAPNWEEPMKPWIKKMGECPLDLMAPYACCDAIASYRLGMYLIEELTKAGLINLYNTLIMDSIPVLSEMSFVGMRMDLSAQADLKAFLEAEMKALEAQATSTIGKEINLNSGKQLGEYWFGDKKYQALKQNKTGPSTDEQTRKYLANRYDDPLVPFVNEYAKYSKLRGTYVNGLADRLDDKGRLHTDLLLQITATGRLSSRNPNLQNIPKRKGKQIRKMFIPDEGCLFADCDYSNLEVRIGAMESEDPILTEMINSGIDVHRKVASMIYGIREEDVTDLQRTYAKTGTFGVMYGMTEEGASYRLGLSMADAIELVKGVKNIFRGLDEWSTNMCNFALENNYVRTRYGRVRNFPIIVTQKDIESIRRKAVNTPIQSLASDVCLQGLARMVQISHILTRQLVVHDSICGSIKYVNDEVVSQIKSLMTSVPFSTKVKLDVDCSFGPSWGEVKTYVY